jgi:hypothetical protein
MWTPSLPHFSSWSTTSEVITLAIFARWSRFSSERDFYRYATGHLTEAFPIGEAIGRALAAVTIEDVAGWFAHAGYQPQDQPL